MINFLQINFSVLKFMGFLMRFFFEWLVKETIISITNLTKCYRAKKEIPPLFALKEINFQVNYGDIFGIIGMSGAGKSTLMRCLTALEEPTEGKVCVSNLEISSLKGKDLRSSRKKMGMIFQHFNLFSSRTVIDNIAYPLEISGIKKKERIAQARELLALVGLERKERYFPAQLSGGEKQRVAIARALIHHPDILLCDEATSALDPSTTHDILELLSKLNQQLHLTILLITHEMEVIKQICTRVAVLEHGEIVEQGAVATLFAKPKHPTTRRFLLNTERDITQVIDLAGKDSLLLRLSFKGETARQPIISRLVREHDVEVNILMGGIDVLKTDTVGNLIVELKGSALNRSKARAFLETQGIECDELL